MPKTRAEIPSEYTWDFTHIYESDEAWESALAAASPAIDRINALQDGLVESAATLRAGLDFLFATAEDVQKIFLYAMLRKNLDNGDAKYQTMYGKAMNLQIQFSTASAFLDPLILSVEREKLTAMLADPALATYRHMLENIDRARAHTKDAETEGMLALLADAAETPSDCFDMLESVDMTFPEITDKDGNKTLLTHGNFGVFRESSDPNVRREAFELYFGEFKKYLNTFAALYAGNVKMDNFFTRVRNYGSACEQALFANNAPIAVYDQLIESIHQGLPIMKRYLALRKRALGLENLHMHDLYCPIVAGVEMKIPYEEAKEIVRQACKPLGEAYLHLLDRAFNERWIDVYETKGKTTGAYSCGVYGAHP